MHFNNPPVIKNNQASIQFQNLDLAEYQDFINVRKLAKYEEWYNDQLVKFQEMAG